MTPINETHIIVSFIGNGTLTVPDTGETVKMTNDGNAFISPLTESAVSAYGKENVFSEDGDTSAITFYEILQDNPTTLQRKGLVIAMFDTNATGSLAPFNGMMVAGVYDEDPEAHTTNITLWEWESGIPLPTGTTGTIEEPPLTNTTTTTNATTTGDAGTTAGNQTVSGPLALYGGGGGQ
jgi:hypothetical protein